ncbi:hypothetical protein QCA50_002741 [Cerrena zonata]|uniref:Uncharacterized protein n=1 Tax=Cerrena zonata TaxID=2478898 RepID=A0AAW0GUW2_9APHY
MATRPQYARNRNGRIPKTPQRSNSVLGRLKSLFINPFGAWVGSDLENEQGKRPRHTDTGYGADQDDDSVRRSKRKRLDASLDDTDQLFEQPTFHPVTNGYLDPPQEAFNPPLTSPLSDCHRLRPSKPQGGYSPRRMAIIRCHHSLPRLLGR